MVSNPDIIWILPVSLAAGLLGRVLRLPGGALLCSTVAVALVVNLFHLSHVVPGDLMFILQAAIGSMLGQTVNRRFWHDISLSWRPALMVVGTFTLMAIPFAGLLVAANSFDELTAFLAATPARMQDVIILAHATDSDAVTVMVMQLLRQMCIIVMTPLLLAGATRKDRSPVPARETLRRAGDSLGEDRPYLKRYALVFLLVPALAGGYVGNLSGHPLGTLLGSFGAVGASRLISLRLGEVPFPRSLNFLIQCLAGVLLGVRITPEVGDLILSRLVPLVLGVGYIVGTGLFLTRMLQWRYGWSRELSWISASPGRTSDMLAISQDLPLSNADRVAIVSVHAVRQVFFTLLLSVVAYYF